LITVQNVSRPLAVEVVDAVPIKVSVALSGPAGSDGQSTLSYGPPWAPPEIGGTVLASWDSIEWMFEGTLIYVSSQNTRQLVGWFTIQSVNAVNRTSLLLRVPDPQGRPPLYPEPP
jgi:hypothetical protein